MRLVRQLGPPPSGTSRHGPWTPPLAPAVPTLRCTSCGAPHLGTPVLGRCRVCCRIGTLVPLVDGGVPPSAPSAPSTHTDRPECPHGRLGLDLADEADGDADDGPLLASSIPRDSVKRVPCGEPLVDALLTGGWVPGLVYYIGGDPGAGKSTFVKQCARGLIKNRKLGGSVYYLTAEELESQVNDDARRLGMDLRRLHIWKQRSIDRGLAPLATSPFEDVTVLVVDALQMFTAEGVRGEAGSPTQCPRVYEQIIACTQALELVTFLVSRVNSAGRLAGPNSNDHDGDATIRIDYNGKTDDDPERRIRVKKNRKGEGRGYLDVTMGPQGLDLANAKPPKERRRTRNARCPAGRE